LVQDNELVDAGPHEETTNGSVLKNGVYYYTMEADGFKSTKKLLQSNNKYVKRQRFE
jgi:hypothetical protein